MRRAIIALSACLALAACQEQDEVPQQYRVPGASPERGEAIMQQVGCGACHIIPGVAGARGTVGPSLEEFGRRSFIAGTIPNRPGTLAAWIRDAPSFDPDTAMPAMPLSNEEARDAAAYLYTLR